MLGLISLKPIGAPVGTRTTEIVAEADGVPDVPHNVDTAIEPASADVQHSSAEDTVPTTDAGQMAKVQLMTVNKQSGELYNMISDSEQLEGWVQEKLNLAAEYIASIHEFVTYDKTKPKTLGSGEGAPAEPDHI